MKLDCQIPFNIENAFDYDYVQLYDSISFKAETTGNNINFIIITESGAPEQFLNCGG